MMEVEATISIRFELHHPRPANGGRPDYETGEPDADAAMASALEQKATWLAQAGDRREFRIRVEELQADVAERCGAPSARDSDVTRAIYRAMRGFLRERGWGDVL